MVTSLKERLVASEEQNLNKQRLLEMLGTPDKHNSVQQEDSGSTKQV